jgi:hypothetical protein
VSAAASDPAFHRNALQAPPITEAFRLSITNRQLLGKISHLPPGATVSRQGNGQSNYTRWAKDNKDCANDRNVKGGAGHSSQNSSSDFTILNNCSSSTGFVMQELAPKSKALRICSGALEMVRTTTGMCFK